jgi:hypothetical protein
MQFRRGRKKSFCAFRRCSLRRHSASLHPQTAPSTSDSRTGGCVDTAHAGTMASSTSPRGTSGGTSSALRTSRQTPSKLPYVRIKHTTVSLQSERKKALQPYCTVCTTCFGHALANTCSRTAHTSQRRFSRHTIKQAQTAQTPRHTRQTAAVVSRAAARYRKTYARAA